MSERKLTIALKADTREAEKLKKVLDDLSQRGSKVSRSFQGVSGGILGKEGMKGATAKALLAEKNLFSDLGKEGQKTARIFEREVTKSTDVMRNKLKETNVQIKSLTKDFEHYSKLSSQYVRNTRYSNMAQSAQMSLMGAMGQKAALMQALGGLGGGGGGGGFANTAFGGALNTGLSYMGLGGLTGGAGVLGVAGAVYGAAQLARSIDAAFSGGRVAAHMIPLQNAVMLGQGVNTFAAGAALGDPLSAARLTASRESQYQSLREAEYTRSVHSSSWSGLLNPSSWFNKSSWLGKTFGVTEAGVRYDEMFKQAEAEASMKVRAAIEAQDKAHPEAAAIRDKMFGAARQKMDLQWLLGRGNNVGLHGTQKIWNELYGYAGGFGGYYAPEELSTLTQGLVTAGGTSARHKLGALLGAMQSGYTSAEASNLLLGSAVGGNVLTPMWDMGFGARAKAMIGGAANTYLSPSSYLGGQGSMDALTDVLGRNITGDSFQQARTAQQNIRGLQILDSMASGGDAWQRSVNLASAIQNFGYGKSIYGQNALANLSYGDLIRFGEGKGAMPLGLQGMGITKEHLQAQRRSLEQSFFSRWADNGADQSSAAQLLRQVRDQYGGNWSAWKGSRTSEQAREQLGMMSGLVSGIGGGLFGSGADAEGMLNILAGTTSRVTGRAGPGEASIEAQQLQESNQHLQSIDANMERLLERLSPGKQETFWINDGKNDEAERAIIDRFRNDNRFSVTPVEEANSSGKVIVTRRPKAGAP